MAKKFDPKAFDTSTDQATKPPERTVGQDPFAPLRNRDAAPPPAPPPAPKTVGEALGEAARAADNYVRAFSDDWTYGGLDKAIGTFGGDTAAERAKTQQAKDELGTGGRLAAGTMATLTNPVTAAIKTGTLLKSGAMGAFQGAADAWGHGGSLSDVLWGGATGGAVGTGLHGVGLGAAEAARRFAGTSAGKAIANSTVGQKIRGLMGESPASITASAAADRDVALRNLDNIEFNPSDTMAGARNVQAQLYGGTTPKWLESDTPGTSGTLRRYVGNMINARQTGQNAGGNSLHSVLRDLNEIISSKPGTEDAKAAIEARDQVTQMFSNITPLNAPQGTAKAALDTANSTHATYKNALMLERMKTDLNQEGLMPGGEVKKILDDPNRVGFYNPAQKAALTDIKNAGTGTVGTIGGKESLILPGIGGAFGAAQGVGPLAAGVGLGTAAEAAQRLSTKAGARQAIADAYPSLTGDFMQNPEQQALRAMKYVGLGSLGGDDSKPTPYQYLNNPYSGFINDMLPQSWQR